MWQPYRHNPPDRHRQLMWVIRSIIKWKIVHEHHFSWRFLKEIQIICAWADHCSVKYNGLSLHLILLVLGENATWVVWKIYTAIDSFKSSLTDQVNGKSRFERKWESDSSLFTSFCILATFLQEHCSKKRAWHIQCISVELINVCEWMCLCMRV